jgi:hypothetical protein
VGEDLNEAWRLFLRIFDPRLMGGELTMLLDFSTQVSCFALYFSTSRDRSPSSDTGPYFILRRRVALHSTRPIRSPPPRSLSRPRRALLPLPH